MSKFNKIYESIMNEIADEDVENVDNINDEETTSDTADDDTFPSKEKWKDKFSKALESITSDESSALNKFAKKKKLGLGYVIVSYYDDKKAGNVKNVREWVKIANELA